MNQTLQKSDVVEKHVGMLVHWEVDAKRLKGENFERPVEPLDEDSLAVDSGKPLIDEQLILNRYNQEYLQEQ